MVEAVIGEGGFKPVPVAAGAIAPLEDNGLGRASLFPEGAAPMV